MIALTLAALLATPLQEKLDGNLTLLISDQMNVGDKNIVRARITSSGGPTSGSKLSLNIAQTDSSGVARTATRASMVAFNSFSDVYFATVAAKPGRCTINFTATSDSKATWKGTLTYNVVDNISKAKAKDSSLVPGNYVSLPADDLSTQYAAGLTVSQGPGTNQNLVGWFAPAKGSGVHLQWKAVKDSMKSSIDINMTGTDENGAEIQAKGTFAPLSGGKLAMMEVVIPNHRVFDIFFYKK